MELKCPKCGVSCGKLDLFCKKCGTSVRPGPETHDQSIQFRMDVIALLRTLKEFRLWIDRRDKKNVRFMRSYKERIEKEIGPSLREFDEKYKDREEVRSPLFGLTREIFFWLSRPINLMEMKIRPSVSIGIFLERLMMTKAAESYLKECCQEADHRLDELVKKIKTDPGYQVLRDKNHFQF